VAPQGKEMHDTTRGKWSEPGVPHRGWTCIGVEDLEDDLMTCEMCEFATIRYAHSMMHPEYANELLVGCICAENMEQGYAAREAEKRLRNLASVRQRWLLRKWQESARGNPYLKTRDHFHIVVWRNLNGSWGGKVTDLDYEQEVTAKRRYASEDAAKMAAFKAVQHLKNRRDRVKVRHSDWDYLV
jgi:hypothetical protein